MKEFEKAKAITKLQRRIILLATLYYQYDYSEVSDFQYDELAKELERMQNEESLGVCRETQYWYIMKDFSSSTGFDIYSKLNKYDAQVFDGVAKDVLYDAGICFD